MTSDIYSVLLVSKDNKVLTFITSMLLPPVFEVTISNDFNEARRIAKEKNYNIIIVDSGDGFDTEFAIDVSNSSSTVLLMVSQEHFDQISYQVECYGILTITKPFDGFYFYNMIKISIAVQYKIQVLTSQTVKLKEKMEEIRLVNRAKILLMQNLNMSEQDAHHYIEKESMNRCIKKTNFSEEIIKTYS